MHQIEPNEAPLGVSRKGMRQQHLFLRLPVLVVPRSMIWFQPERNAGFTQVCEQVGGMRARMDKASPCVPCGTSHKMDKVDYYLDRGVLQLGVF